MFLFHRLSFAFCYDLNLWAEGQALRSFFIETSFAIILSRVWRGSLIKHVKKLHTQIYRQMTLLFLTFWLTYFCICCVGLDFRFSDLDHLC